MRGRVAIICGALLLPGLLLLPFVLVAKERREGVKLRAASEIAELSTALEAYRVDHGVYPRSPATDNLRPEKDFDPATYIEASKCLHAALEPESGKIYFRFAKGTAARDAEGEIYAVDPLGNSYGYSTSQDSQTGRSIYRLWSTDGGTREKDVKRWVKNW